MRTPCGGASEELSELFNPASYVPVIIAHFFNKPIQNSELLRKLYLENDLSSYEISQITGWPRSSISDSLRDLDIKKESIKAPNLSFGEKLQGTKRIVHKGEQKIIDKMITLKEEGLSFTKIAQCLNDENIPTKTGGSWYPSTVKNIIKRELKKREV